MTQIDEEIYIQTTAKNGMKVCIPLSKLEEFKKSQENPDKEKIAKVKEKLHEDFLQRRKQSEQLKLNKVK